MAMAKFRTPVIPLDYSEKHKAVKKELLVDYETGNIYVVSKEDQTLIIDITKKIYNQLEKMSGNNITVEIEGIGEINLIELIGKIQSDIDKSVKVIYTGQDTNYVGKELTLDERSLHSINRNMEIVGFGEADILTIPRKSKDGTIEWIEVPQLNDSGSNGSTNGDIIPPSNPDDSLKMRCFIVEPTNYDKLYLRASRRQKSMNIDKNCKVILPRVLDEFSEIEWYVCTNSFAPKFLFGNSVQWTDIDNIQPKAKMHHVYSFKTWDFGETWMGELKTYNRILDNSDSILVTRKFLDDNYYTINEVNTIVGWKEKTY